MRSKSPRDQVHSDDFAAIISVVGHEPHPSAHYKALLREVVHLAHVTVEVQTCEGSPA